MKPCLRPPVFIVDDDPDALRSLGFLLESEGYPVRSYDDGLGFLAAAVDSSCPAIIDVQMPGMDGLAVSRHLRERRSTAPILLITGHPDPAIRTRAHAMGIPLIEKPLSQDALLSALDRAVAADGST